MPGKARVRGEGEEKALRGSSIIYNKWVKPLTPLKAGDLVELESSKGEIIACGVWEEGTPVAVRVFYRGECFHSSAIEALEDLLGEALKAREASGILRSFDSFRLVNSDGDMISGLIVDVYSDVAVIQSSSPAIDRHLGVVVGFLSRELGVKHVYEKSTQRSRLDIGLEPRRRWLRGGKSEVVITEGSARFYVNVVEGQKTGFFLDQRPNRLELSRYVNGGERVLDVFSYTGAFGIHAALAGARQVVFIEEDPKAAAVLVRNLRLNGLNNYRVINKSVWEIEGDVEENAFDVVIVDPPAFIQSGDSESIRKGLRAYRRSYLWSLNRASPNSIVYLSSCSYFMKRDMFLKLVNEVITAKRWRYRLFGSLRGAGPDHTLRGEEHLDYLKGAFLKLDKDGFKR